MLQVWNLLVIGASNRVSVMNDMPERSPSQPSAQAIAQNAPIAKRPPPTKRYLAISSISADEISQSRVRLVWNVPWMISACLRVQTLGKALGLDM